VGATKIRRGNLTLYPNYKLGPELRRTAVFDDELRRLANLGALGAREVAVKDYYGVDSHTGQIGAYFNSIHAELGKNRKGLRVGLVQADDWKAHWAENPPRQETGRRRGKILARGARRSGMRVRAPRKRG
jgi:hypothetical protein